MKTEPFTLDLPHELSHDELIAKGADLSRTLDEITGIEAEKKLATSTFKTRIEEKQSVVRRLSESIRTGKEMRSFECFERMNTAERTIETVRSDTEKVVSSRPMTPDEHQLHMDVMLERMQEQAERRKQHDAATAAAADTVVAAAESGGEREHLALPAETTTTKKKKKGGAERIREKKAAMEAAAKNKGKGSGKASAPSASKPKSKGKGRSLVEREDFIDTDSEEA